MPPPFFCFPFLAPMIMTINFLYFQGNSLWQSYLPITEALLTKSQQNAFNSFMVTSIYHLVDNCGKQRKLKSWYLIPQLSVASNFAIRVINILNIYYIKCKWASLCLLQIDSVIFISVYFSVCTKLGWFKHLCSPSHLN